MLAARETKMLSAERIERMIDAPTNDEAAKILEECGYGDLSGLSAKEAGAALEAHIAALFDEVEGMVPEAQLVQLFRLKYDYHNAKALIPGGTIGTDRVLAAFDSAEALTALYGNTWLGNAAAAGAAAMSGGALTAFELLCDNALMDYIRAAKLRSFGAAHVTAYLAAMENETTAARMILTGRLAGLQPAVIRERLRETYA